MLNPMQGWAIALFEKERITLFLAKERFALFALFRSFCKEQRSGLLFCALFNRAKEQFALWRSF